MRLPARGNGIEEVRAEPTHRQPPHKTYSFNFLFFFSIFTIAEEILSYSTVAWEIKILIYKY